jgi:hypothetical protein
MGSLTWSTCWRHGRGALFCINLRIAETLQTGNAKPGAMGRINNCPNRRKLADLLYILTKWHDIQLQSVIQYDVHGQEYIHLSNGSFVIKWKFRECGRFLRQDFTTSTLHHTNISDHHYQQTFQDLLTHSSQFQKLRML